MSEDPQTPSDRSKDPLFVLLVWLGTLAFLCCVASDARAESLSQLSGFHPSADRFQLCLAALGLWSLAALRARLTGTLPSLEEA